MVVFMLHRKVNWPCSEEAQSACLLILSGRKSKCRDEGLEVVKINNKTLNIAQVVMYYG